MKKTRTPPPNIYFSPLMHEWLTYFSYMHVNTRKSENHIQYKNIYMDIIQQLDNKV